MVFLQKPKIILGEKKVFFSLVIMWNIKQFVTQTWVDNSNEHWEKWHDIQIKYFFEIVPDSIMISLPCSSWSLSHEQNCKGELMQCCQLYLFVKTKNVSNEKWVKFYFLPIYKFKHFELWYVLGSKIAKINIFSVANSTYLTIFTKAL